MKGVAQTGVDEKDVTDKEAGMAREDVTDKEAGMVREGVTDARAGMVRTEEKRSMAEEAKPLDGCRRMSGEMAAGTAAMVPCG